MELNPRYAIAHYWYAEYLMAMGRTEQAVARVQHAWELDPLNSVINASAGMIRYLAHDYDGALSALGRGLEIDPAHYVSHLRVGLACLQKGLVREGTEAMQRAVELSGGSTEALAGLGAIGPGVMALFSVAFSTPRPTTATAMPITPNRRSHSGRCHTMKATWVRNNPTQVNMTRPCNRTSRVNWLG